MIKLKVRKRRKTSHPREHRPPGKLERFLGWCVHGYTALGLVAAAMIAVLLVQGGPDRGQSDAFRWSFLLMAIATDRRRDRRNLGSKGPDQGGRARVRRPSPG